MTKSCTNVLQGSTVSIFLMFLILSRFNMAILHLLVVCVFMDSATSRYASRYFITSLLSILVPFTFMPSDIHLASCCHDPNRANSIFPSFIFNLLMSIQVLMFMATFSRSPIASFSLLLFCHPALKAFFTKWSSANPWRGMSEGMTSWRVLAYTRYATSPIQIPWVTLHWSSCSKEYTKPTLTLQWQTT